MRYVTVEQEKELCRSISRAAKDLDYNVIFFTFIGTIGADYQNYAQNEHKMLDIIPFDELDGIIFDNSNSFTDDIKNKIMSHIKKCRCPVVTIGETCNDYYRVHIDNSEGIKNMVRHFAKHHGFKHIGFMSGIPGHCDAVERYAAFQSAMRECGLPEDGVGVFTVISGTTNATKQPIFFLIAAPVPRLLSVQMIIWHTLSVMR